MVFEGTDVLGDGVNIAARLQESAAEGCINISEAVFREVKNKPGIEAEFIEEKKLKNLGEPVRIYSVSMPVSRDFSHKTSSTVPYKEELQKPSGLSIVVLPFDPDALFFLIVTSVPLGKTSSTDVYTTRFIKIDPLSYLPHACLGIVLWAQSRFDLALSYWRTAYRLDPESQLSRWWFV